MYKKKGLALGFLFPFILMVGVFLIYPFCKNIQDSFLHYESILDKNPTFVGFENYKTLFSGIYFQNSLKSTLIMVLLVIVFQVGIALILALLVSSIKKFSTFYKVSFFMPIVISATALGLMFNLFYDYEFGMFNQILNFLNLEKVVWKDPTNFSRLYTLVVTPVIWQYIGFYFVIFLSGLTGISDELLEAADIDGCTGLQKVFLIKIPLLKNLISTCMVLAITGTLKVFDLPFIISPAGLPDGKTNFLGSFMYQLIQGVGNVGQAAGFAVFIVVLGVVMSSVSNFIFRTNDDL